MTIQQLDIDGFRLDKALQITVDALSDWSHAMRECARSVGKENFCEYIAFIYREHLEAFPDASIQLYRVRSPAETR